MKKLNKFFAILVSLAMMATLCVSMAFAKTNAPSTTKSALADSKISKVWVIPEGVKDPSLQTTFTFSSNREESSGVTSTETLPSVATVTNTYRGDANTTTAGKKYVVNSAIPEPTGVTHAGVYAFDVVEAQPTITNDPVLEANGSVSKDNTQYRIRYYYETEQVNTGTEEEPVYVNQPKLTGITVSTVTQETYYEKDGEEVAEGTEGAEEKTRDVEVKVTPTVPGTQTDGYTNENLTGFKFTNVYTVTDGTPGTPTTEEPITVANDALNVSKTVTNNNSDATPFPFTLTITAATGQEETAINAYIVDSTTGLLINDATRTVSFTQTGSGTITFYLKSGETLAIPTAPAGTRYTASENLNNDATFNVYTPEYTVTSAGSSGTTDRFSGTAGAGQTLATAGETATSTYLLGSNQKDTVAYTNAYDNSINTPTGILMNNLPYIALALVAIGGMVAYVVVRRKGNEET